MWPTCVSSLIFLNVFFLKDVTRRLLFGGVLPFFLLGGRSVLWGLSCSLFLVDLWDSDWGTCLEFLSTIRVSIRYLLLISVNTLPSSFLLLSNKIMLENTLFQLLPSNVESLGTMNSRRYGRVDVDISDTMDSLKFISH